MSTTFNVYKRSRAKDAFVKIAEGLTGKGFVDLSVARSDMAQYQVTATDGIAEKFGEIVSLDNAYDLVEFLVDGQALSYPSTSILDMSSKNRVITKLGGVLKKDDLKFHYDGIIYFDGVSDGLSLSMPVLNTSDFTFEIRGVFHHAGSEAWSRIFQFGVEQTGYLSLFRSSSSNPAEYVLHCRTTGNVSTTILVLSRLVVSEVFIEICIMRKNGIFYAFVNGEPAGVNNSMVSYNITQTLLYLLRNNASDVDTKASIDAIRFTSYARYSAEGYTPIDFRFK